jgi:hypothetical protein
MENILDPNETIIWSGKPDKKAYMTRSLVGIPLGLFFSIFITLKKGRWGKWIRN